MDARAGVTIMLTQLVVLALFVVLAVVAAI